MSGGKGVYAVGAENLPKEPEPIFFPKRYLPPTRRSILVLEDDSAVVGNVRGGKWESLCGVGEGEGKMEGQPQSEYAMYKYVEDNGSVKGEE